MNVQYIIVQTGGTGTRLGALTRNRPKALVPVNNLPILFHLFKKFPDKNFVIIGDYQADVLERYLQTFSKVKYLLVRTQEKGNAAGVQDALEFLPERIPFMLIWSDLLLSEEYRLPEETRPCYVGVSGNFLCSWRLDNGKLEKISSIDSGVAGCFVFDKKERLATLPREGSFAQWLAESGLPLTPMNLQGSVETGTVEALRSIDSGENRCRPYNHMKFFSDRVEKTGLTPEGKLLIEREIRWYQRVSDYGFQGIPRIYCQNPLTMERIHGDNIFKAELSDMQKRETIRKLVDALETLHHYESVERNCFDLQKDYFNKTLARLQGIRTVIPFSNDPYITVNGEACKNIFFFEKELNIAVREKLFEAEFGPIHGDCTLTNTMIDKTGRIYFIDARGYFGDTELFGDVYYDWSKLYYSIQGRFDQFNVKQFSLEILEDRVQYTISPSGWEHLTEYFLSLIPGCDIGKIKLIHAIIWMSLASHCWEDYDSMCLAFYNGLYLWNEWMKERNM